MIREWFWRIAEFLDGKKTYISSGAAVLIGASVALRKGGTVDWEGVVMVVIGLLTFLFRALARKPGMLVKQ